MCINSTKGRFLVDRSDKSFIFTNNLYIKKGHYKKHFILRPLLFAIFMCNLFFIVKEIDFAIYANNNSPFVSGDTPDDVLDSPENASSKLCKWFSNIR